MNIEDIKVGNTYWFDDARDSLYHNKPFKVVYVSHEDLPYPVSAVFDFNESESVDMLAAHEVSAFPLQTKESKEQGSEYVDRLKKAVAALEETTYGNPIEEARVLGKIQGVKLALSYWEEMDR